MTVSKSWKTVLWDIAGKAIYQYHALQKQEELYRYLWLLSILNPRIHLEIGCDAGGSLWATKQVLPRAIIFGITLVDGPYSSQYQLAEEASNGCYIIDGDSQMYDTRGRLMEILNEQHLDSLFIDADHSYDGVEADYRMYSPLVHMNGMIAFHDICHHTHPGIGVERFWQSIPKRTHVELVSPPTDWGGIGVMRKWQ